MAGVVENHQPHGTDKEQEHLGSPAIGPLVCREDQDRAWSRQLGQRRGCRGTGTGTCLRCGGSTSLESREAHTGGDHQDVVDTA
eukprot:7737910-Lingulodinium_polyedra.AAC.1